ncbi:hypothetical protein GC167_06155 [bacterium]|nr:hypothetical protein [bacterium]
MNEEKRGPQFSIPRILALSAIALSAAGCARETLPGLSFGDPIFQIHGTVAGDTLSLEAGNKGYYMHTPAFVDAQGMEVLSGLLSPDGLTPQKALRLNVRSLNGPGSDTHTDEEALAAGIKPSYSLHQFDTLPGLFRFAFQMTDSLGVTSQQWSYGNGTFSASRAPSVVFDENQQQQYPVRLTTVESSSGCSAIVTHYIDLAQDDCRGTFWIQQGTGTTTWTGVGQVIQGGAATIEWTLDGLPYAQGNSCTMNMLTAGPHELCAEFIFPDGCRNIACRTFVIDNFGSWSNAPCQNDFVYTMTKVASFDSLQTGSAELIYYDENGQAFSSFLSDDTGAFEILESAFYSPDAQGRPTYSVRFRFQGVVRSASGEVLLLDLPEARMAVGALE